MGKPTQAIVIALIGALGGGLGAIMAHSFHPAEVQRELLEEARREAYVDWFRAVQLDRQTKRLVARAEEVEKMAEEHPEEATRLEEAKSLREQAQETDDEFESVGGFAIARIAIYGEALIVREIIKWYEIWGVEPCGDDPGINQEIRIYESMRRSLMADEEVVDIGEIAVLSNQCTLETNETEQG